MKYYVTKWWSTKGIMEMMGDLPDMHGDVLVKHPEAVSSCYLKSGLEVFETLEDAKCRVAELAERKVRSLRKKADELEAKWL